MLLRRLLSSRPLRLRLQTLAPTTTTTFSSSSPRLASLSSRRHHNPLPFRLLSPRCLSTSGPGGRGGRRGDDQPWAFTPDSSDPDPFGHDAAPAPASGEMPFGSDTASGTSGEAPWAEGFGGKGEKGDVFDEIYKEASAPQVGEAAHGLGLEGTGGDEPWTLGGEEEKEDLFAAAVLGEEGIEGIVGGAGDLDELDAAGEDDEERQRQENKAREQELMETLKGPNRAFGDLIAASGITEDMIDSLILLKDVRNIEGLPPLSVIEDKAIQKLNATSSRAEIERQKQEEIAKARVRQVDEKGRAYGTGKRKCSIARVWVQPGDGKFIVNDKQFDAYFPMLDNRAELLSPFIVTKTLGLWDVTCTVKGGGVSGQVGAIRLGISRALQNWEPGFRPYLKAAGYLTRDARVVERKKPGKAKARKSFQWVKR